MFRLEVKRLDPVRTANILGLVQAAIMLAFVLLLAPFLLIALMIGVSQDAEALVGIIPMFVLIVVYPIVGLIFGWIGGFLAAAVYNFVIRFTGGLILEFEDLGGTFRPIGDTQAPPPVSPPGVPGRPSE